MKKFSILRVGYLLGIILGIGILIGGGIFLYYSITQRYDPQKITSIQEWLTPTQAFDKENQCYKGNYSISFSPPFIKTCCPGYKYMNPESQSTGSAGFCLK